MNYLDDLNPEQKKAALHTHGPLLIVAGAGAGKTKTVTHRIRHLIETGVPANQILAITFTNKAAKELRDRLAQLIGPSSWGGMPFASTFHSLGVYILREYAEAAGIPRHFSIVDKSDALSILRRATKERGYDPKTFPPEKLSAIISSSKADLIGPREFAEKAGNNQYGSAVATIWPIYERMLGEQKSLDFDDLIMKTVLLFRKNPTVLEACQERWKYIHIDEYQDTNVSQYELSRLLASKYKEICVVGDADQCIYTWRKADFKNILRFERDWPGTTVILLEENYRSSQTILEAANAIIAKNSQRIPKNLFTSKGAGEKISIFQAIDESDEARWIVQGARELMRAGTKQSEIAVLYRANYQSRSLEEQFLRANVPYQLLGVRFFERKEVKDVLAYIKASINPDDIEAFKRAVATPSRGIGETTITKIAEKREHELNRPAQEKVSQFRQILSAIKAKSVEAKPSELIRFAVERSGIENALIAESEEERLENVKELASLAAKYDEFPGTEGVERLLSDAALAADQDSLMENKDGVRLMTVHSSKGLEFDAVFIAGLEEGLFPHQRFDETSDPEEERRLFYVAVTRARAKLHLSWATSRMIFGVRQYGQPSEFLADIHDGLTDTVKNESMMNRAWGSASTMSRHTDDEDIISWDCLK